MLGVAETMSQELKALLAYVTAEDRICPQPQRWNDLWELLPNRERVGSGWRPSLPLILGAWSHTSDSEKSDRFHQHIHWANDHGALERVNSFLRELDESQWHHLGE